MAVVGVNDSLTRLGVPSPHFDKLSGPGRCRQLLVELLFAHSIERCPNVVQSRFLCVDNPKLINLVRLRDFQDFRSISALLPVITIVHGATNPRTHAAIAAEMLARSALVKTYSMPPRSIRIATKGVGRSANFMSLFAIAYALGLPLHPAD